MKNQNTRKGRAFENYIEKLYQNLGFSTNRNINIEGQQIDIEAHKYIDGAGEMSILIECKYLDSGNVSNQVSQDFVSTINALKTKVDFNKGILITNRNFTANSKKLSSGTISFLTVQELEQEILNLNSAYIDLKKEYERKEIYTQYIPISATYTETRKEISNIEAYIVKKATYSSFVLSVLADYGSGKTTLLQRLFYQLTKKFLQEEINKKPFYLELKSFNKYKSSDEFLINMFYKTFRRDIPIDLLKSEIEQGNFFFLLDGFDEMSTQYNESVRLKNFKAISPILKSNCTSILTCRPSYYVSNKEYNSYIDMLQSNTPKIKQLGRNNKYSTTQNLKAINNMYQSLRKSYIPNDTTDCHIIEISTITLNSFDDKQIDNFLKKFNSDFLEKCKSTWEDIKKFLLNIYDLSELMSKPLLLKMIKDTIISQGEKYQNNGVIEFTPASLYEVYTNINLDLDWEKGVIRQLLTQEQRSNYAEIIALAMFEKQVLELSFKELKSLIESSDVVALNLEKEFDKVSLQDIISDVQICSFITRTEDDTFRFVHKSFMEFFVAKNLKNSIKSNTFDYKFNTSSIPKEILYFIGSYGHIDKEIKNKLYRKLNTTDNKDFRRNITCAYIYSDQKHEKLKLTNVSIDDYSLSKTEFNTCKFNNVTFIHTEFKYTVFNKCDCNIDFNTCVCVGVSTLESTGTIMQEQSTFNKCSFQSDSNVLKLAIENSRMKNSNYSNLTIHISSSIFEKCNLDKCIVRPLSTEKPRSESTKFQNTIFKDCLFEGVNINYIKADKSQFQKCKGVCITYVDTDEIHYENYGFDHRGCKYYDDLVIINLSLYKNRIDWIYNLITKKIKKVSLKK